MENILYARFNREEKTYPIRSKAVFDETYNEELDSGEIILDHVAKADRPSIQRLDLCEILDKDSNVIYRLLIDEISSENLRTLRQTENYWTYTIKLMSEAKALELVVLPNLRITQNKIGSKNDILFYINQYTNLYAEKVRTDTGYVPFYSVSSEVTRMFQNVECPEMQWNNPTLREVLTSLMLVKDCIPVIKDHVLGYMSLTKRNGEINNSFITYEKNNEKESDYASDLYSSIDNVMQTDVSGIDTTVNVCEYVGFRTTGDSNFILDDNNLKLVTLNPIVRLKKVIISFYVSINTSSTIQYKVVNRDITDLITEKDEYSTKPVYYSATVLPENLDWDTFKSYQNNSLYFTRYSNTIEGFGVQTKVILGLTTRYELTSLLNKIAKEQRIYNNKGVIDGTGEEYLPTSGTTKYDAITFKIEYETTANCLAKAGRYLGSKHSKVVADNQSSSFVDSYRQGIFEYSKVDRLGNEVSIIHGRYDNFSDIPSLAQTYEGKVIYKKEIAYYRNSFAVDMYTTENYILKDYWTGVRSKIRTYTIASGNEASLRHDIDKVYLEFSFSKKTDTYNYFSSDSNLPLYFLSSFQYIEVPSTINAVVTRFAGKEYQPDLISRLFGRSLLFSWHATDNYEIGRGLTKYNTYNVINPYKYTDDNGNIDFYQMYFYDSITFSNGKAGYLYVDSSSFDTIITDTSKAQCDKNLLDTTPVVNVMHKNYNRFNLGKSLHKDQREILGETLQFEFCADTTDIYVSKKFLERQQSICAVPRFYETPVVENSYNYYHVVNSSYVYTQDAKPTAEARYYDKYCLEEYTVGGTNKLTVKLYQCKVSSGTFYWEDLGDAPIGIITKNTDGNFYVLTVVQEDASIGGGFKWNYLYVKTNFELIDLDSHSGTSINDLHTSANVGKLFLVNNDEIHIVIAILVIDASTGTTHTAYTSRYAFTATNGNLFNYYTLSIYQYYNGSFVMAEQDRMKLWGSTNENNFGQNKTNELDSSCSQIGVDGDGSFTIAVSSIDKYSAKVSFHSVNLISSSGYHSYAITDSNNNIILTWNGNAGVYENITIYLNILQNHNDYIYSHTDLDKIVGSIVG